MMTYPRAHTPLGNRKFRILTLSDGVVQDVQLFSVFKWDGNTGVLELDILETDFLECIVSEHVLVLF